ncbi:MAG: carbamoyltransferase [Gammaproteobacteria bacterium]|nr:MAG: carbamoyltransferase [Gammaproteobacteria bacterium]
MIVLGLNAYHGDSAACLVRDGRLIAAAEEERFRRVKHWAGLPTEAVRYCLEEAGAGLADISYVAINSDPHANFWHKTWFALTHRPDPRLIWSRLTNQRRRVSVEEALRAAFPDSAYAGGVHFVEHHLAHLASAFLVSPFEEAVTVSVDGFGDFASAAWGSGHGARINVDGKVHFPHSLGIFYQAMTQYLGFPHYGDEYKVMGLAPYGEPRYLPQMRNIVCLQEDGTFWLNLDYFRHHREKVEYTWNNGEPSVGRLYSTALEAEFGPSRGKHEALTQHHKDLARSVQAMYEEAFFHLLNSLHARYRLDTLSLAGGCAMNSVANGKIYRNTPFKQVYIQSAAGDAGGAIGAAMILWHQMNGGARRNSIMDHAYWGPQFNEEQISGLLGVKNEEIQGRGCRVERIIDEDDLCRRTAGSIAEGRVVGWFQGRMEWGPRALGNRSILCDPRRADMKDILNIKIKRRESFRPFAPSVLREAVSEWFETDDDVPFMMQVFQIKEKRRALIPAVTHVDGSGRLQTVHRDTNPRYYRLIEKFYDLTGVPMLLNTSFNENEPVVCRPEEALDCFLRTKMDVLVMGNWVVTRNNG